MPKSDRKLKPQVPGVVPGPVPTIDPASVPASFLAEIEAMSNEGLIALSGAETDGENRAEFIAAIDAELRKRIKALEPGEPILSPEPEPAPKPKPQPAPPAQRLGLPSAASIDPATITTAVLCIEGWVVPIVSTPPPIR